MPMPVKIGFAGTDARTLLSAAVVTQTGRQGDIHTHRGVVIRGMPAMPKIANVIMGWDVGFIPTADNSAESYATAIGEAMAQGELDYVIPMPESLLFNGIVDRLEEKGLGGRIAGLSRAGAFIEGDKIQCKELCRKIGIPVADELTVVDARSFSEVSKMVLEYIHTYGGAVLKFPYSAGGKGARIILDTWEMRSVYDALVRDYKKTYRRMFKSNPWPLLIESRMSGVEISFTILVDARGNFRVLPTAMDYPERFEGPATSGNPITGGMGSISPHPFESWRLMEMVSELIALPLINELKASGLLRPCILYPGCFVSFRRSGDGLHPCAIRVCEINIRPGEPEFQPVMRRLKNPGQLFEAMFKGELDRVAPQVREDQISITTAFVTGPGGPDGQKGYPWRVTRNEPITIDFPYLKKKGLQVVPSAMGISEEKGLVSDGTRVVYLVCNGTVKGTPEQTAQKLMNKVKTAYDGHRLRLIPREDENGNRFDFRRDIGTEYGGAEKILRT
ncbi:MAG TPA: hypothetical protein DHV36_01880 [Desulfobacteraceae bacterium]|nr:hypothetical protein [Desulfobacteraceae bacterium]